MLTPRVIPCLLIENRKLVKTTHFKNPSYVGDPINAIKIFNEKEVDEIIILDITKNKKHPDFEYISKIASECFMPMCYGGGIRSFEDALKTISCGVEKISLNTLSENISCVDEICKSVGNQSLICSIDVSKNTNGYKIYTNYGTKRCEYNIYDYAVRCEMIGFGELLITNMNYEGTMQGYDISLISKISKCVNIPIIAHGGAGNISDIERAIRFGASACAIGSMAVYHNRTKSVLINFPSRKELKNLSL